MVSQRQQLLPLLRLALKQALEQETLHLQWALILLPSIPCSLLLCCHLHASEGNSGFCIRSGSQDITPAELTQQVGHSTS